MDDTGVSDLERVLDTITVQGATNLWDAVSLGLRRSAEFEGCPVLLLTDGVATTIPPRGHKYMLEKLMTEQRQQGKTGGPLRCLGFGADIDSRALEELSACTGSTFGYIPDVGFLGTATQHVLANILVPAKVDEGSARALRQRMVDLLRAILSESLTLHGPPAARQTERVDLEGLKRSRVLWKAFTEDGAVPAVLKEEQVDFALEDEYMGTWGRHYLRSLLGAFDSQECINFKDASLQVFGLARGQVWKEILDAADTIYCDLPPPKPSLTRRRGTYRSCGSALPPVSMRSYSQQSAPCVHEDTKVCTGPAAAAVKCKDLRIGDSVWTGNRWDEIEYILKTQCTGGVQEFAG